MSNDFLKDELPEQTASQGDEYELMILLERLETLQEELDEFGFGSIQEIEAALSLTESDTDSAELSQKRVQLAEIRDEMLDLGMDNYQEIAAQIRSLHETLDELEQGQTDVG